MSKNKQPNLVEKKNGPFEALSYLPEKNSHTNTPTFMQHVLNKFIYYMHI
jgi:hypothetical protein